MSKFQRGQVVYLPRVLQIEGTAYPMVVPTQISTVNPARGGGFTYHIHFWEGDPEHPTVRNQYSVPECDLSASACEALVAAMEHVALANTPVEACHG